MKPLSEKHAAEIRQLTSRGMRVFARIGGRDVTLEKTGEGEAEKYILTWGLEGEGHGAGQEGLIAILDTRMAVENLLNMPPPQSKKKLDCICMFDDSNRANHLRQVVGVLVLEIVKAAERKDIAYYKPRS